MTQGFFKALASSGQTINRVVPVEISDFQKIIAEGSQTARVTLVTDNREYSEKEISSAFLNRTGKNARLIEGSLTKGPVINGRKNYSVLATVNSPSLNYAENIGRMKTLASSTFLDEEDNIWQAVGDGEQKRLVIANEEDLSDILAARRKYFPNTEFASTKIENGKYSMIWNPSLGKYEFGFPLVTQAGVVLCKRDSGTPTVIDENLIVDQASLKGSEYSEELFDDPFVTLSSAAVEKVLEYYRRIFKDTTFFVQLEQRIRQNRGLA